MIVDGMVDAHLFTVKPYLPIVVAQIFILENWVGRPENKPYVIVVV